MAYVNYHDRTYNPVGLWQLNGNMNDSSGNAFTLQVGAGTERYSDLFPGVRGMHFDGSTRLQTVSFQASLLLQADMTIEFLVISRSRATGTYVSFSSTSTSGAGDNTQYSLGYDTTNGASLFWRSHHGTLVADSYTINNNFSPLVVNHVAATRTANVIQFYLNGLVLGSASTALTSPASGSSGTFRIGSGVSGFSTVPAGIVASVKLCSFALTADQIRGEYNNTIGNFYGNL